MLISSCGMTARFPSDGIVEKAIAMQIYPPQNYLSENLSQPHPRVAITKVQVQKTEINVVENLPTYHLWGSYDVTLQLPRHEFKQSQFFDLYLQQQKQNKSWRLLIPNFSNPRKNTENTSWHSYLISPQ